MGNRKIIIVNAVAASEGGALTILQQFLSEIVKRTMSSQFSHIIFVSNDKLIHLQSENIKFVQVDVKRWDKRILWDTFGIIKWLHKNNLKPFLAISMMSVGMPFLKIPQVIYIHQSLPFGDYYKYKWFEIKYLFYQEAISIWMKLSIRRNSWIIVQTKWMKDAVEKKLSIPPEKIIVSLPTLKTIKKENKIINDYSYVLVYPAIPIASYKNHELLIKVMAILKIINPILGSKLKIYFTSNTNDRYITRYYHNLTKQNSIEENFVWCGYLNHKEMQKLYEISDAILFPSLIETLGLPLLEGVGYGKKIFVMNKPYAKDVVGEYDGASIIEDDVTIWAKEIEQFYSNKKLLYEDKINSSDGWSNIFNLLNQIAC